MLHVSFCNFMSYRIDADGDASCANTEDNAVCVCTGAEGEPPDGLRQTGLPVPSLGKPY